MKLMILDRKFTVDLAKGTVKCEITVDTGIYTKGLAGGLEYDINFNKHFPCVDACGHMVSTGIATLYGDDKWDEEKGMKIAMAKARKNAARSLYNFYVFMSDGMQYRANMFYGAFIWAKERFATEQKRLNAML